MKYIRELAVIIIFGASICTAQEGFSPEDYALFLNTHQNMEYSDLSTAANADRTWYRGFPENSLPWSFSYFDSIDAEIRFTADEQQILTDNRMLAMERMSFPSMHSAIHYIYINDWPLFISSDAVLQALHMNYDRMLAGLEMSLLKPQLETALDSMTSTFPVLIGKYSDQPELQVNLRDVDIYLTMAASLLDENLHDPVLAEPAETAALWNAVNAEQMYSLPLFSDRARNLDFSQFTVRGHYNTEWLRDYFQAMMWLGRMDFFLTPPPENPFEAPWSREEIKRMNISAYLLNELMVSSGAAEILDINDRIISFMVGPADNMTPVQYTDFLTEQGIISADMLLSDSIYDAYQAALPNADGSEQKILSQFIMMDPYSPEPGVLPVSYRLMGQRFLVDSYMFSNLVFDRIIYNGTKIFRPLPKPLDILFILGNSNALPLLENEIETYHYSSQLASLRYLTDSYNEDFWSSTLYNTWLDAVRILNPPDPVPDDLPPLFSTAAWQQSRLNTQLASWAQLRHDNLLYGKQSYTGGTGCSFPHTYIEPVPELYLRLADFADRADAFFSGLEGIENWYFYEILNFFPGFADVMNRLADLAQKEIDAAPFSEDDLLWLQSMMFEAGGSGQPPYTGWITSLYYIPEDIMVQMDEPPVIADVHTQPTDQSGAVVGNILHVASGHPELAVFLIDNGPQISKPTAFIGPVMTYYDTVTTGFKRINDEEWQDLAYAGSLPDRPDWTRLYRSDINGCSFPEARALPNTEYNASSLDPETADRFRLAGVYPNPFNNVTRLEFTLNEPASVDLTVFDLQGREVMRRQLGSMIPGSHEFILSMDGFSSGVYLARISDSEHFSSAKLLLLK